MVSIFVKTLRFIYSPDTNKSNRLVECDEVGLDDTRPY